MVFLQMGRLNFTVILLLISLIGVHPVFSQGKVKNYLGVHKVKSIPTVPITEKSNIRNVVLMIGDGMGISQISAALVANKGELYLEYFPVGGFMKVNSSSGVNTDSGASATAMATGSKTFNGMIGIDKYENKQKTIIEIAESKGFATGIVVTSSVTHATPAAFISHVLSRNYYEMIAAQYLKIDIDVFIGGGRKNFQHRMDERNLLVELMQKGYQLAMNLDDLNNVTSGKVAGLLSASHLPAVQVGRGDMLERSTKKALELLNQNEKGFFLLVEGSQIDWGGHGNDLDYIIEETLDFDKAIGIVLEFAVEDHETLVIVTADHETGGLAMTGGDMRKGNVEGKFSTKGHTADMVPVFAYGPGSEEFGGIIDNTDIFKKISKLLFKK